MKQCLGRRLISFVLSVTILVTALPVSAYAAEQNGPDTTRQLQTTQQSTVGVEEKSLDFDLNGGSFLTGYEAPDSYPAQKLPDWENIEKPGYAFDGWYDNKELSGNVITAVSDTDYSGAVVLYAKWTERCYYVDIPASVTADGSQLMLSGKADGLYEKERVDVSVSSSNEWKLKDGRKTLSYELRDRETNVLLQNDTLVMSLSNAQKSDVRGYICNVTEEPEVTGHYTDALTFQVAFSTEKYTLTFDANGGFCDNPDKPGDLMVLEPQTLLAGTVLDKLPIAIKSGYTFLGWCYDKACTQYVASTDRLLDNVTLYASYTENQQLESHSIATFARAIDVDGRSFVIQVTDKSGQLTADEILASCKLTNLSDFNDNVTLKMTVAGDGIYTLMKDTGWEEGSSYKLVLDNDNLYFTGFDSTIREYEISIHKDEVENIRLNQNLKYINLKDLSDLVVNGQKATSISIATMTLGMDGSVQSQGSSTQGSFTYSGASLQVGSQVAVYSGDVIPTMDSIGSSADGSDISFLEITGANGNQYTYRGSDTEDVLFMPEVLPLDASKDQDGDAFNQSVTVNISDLTFGNDEVSRQLSLDESTTVDEGDFLALYQTIDSGTPSYGKITAVEMLDGKYIIDYQTVTWEEVQKAMDVYRTEGVEGDALLENTNVQALESNIETQAVESGFADQVAGQIAQMAMRTQSYEELQRALEEELGAGIEIVPDTENSENDGQTGGEDKTFSVFGSRKAKKAAGAAKQSRVEVGKPQVRADLDTKLRHFDGNVSGVHLGLEISVPITFHVARYADFEITVKATFEQEVRVAINVDGKAIWKVWGIFPYIADYRVTASLDLYEYTGIGLDVNFKTAEGDNPGLKNPGTGTTTPAAQLQKKKKLAEDVSGIVEELQDMMENGKDYISDKSPLLARIGSSGDDDGEISVAKSLAERYADLLEDESDWVEIYTKRLITKHIRVILVIDIAIEVDFVVSANVNISVGMTFWYKNAKRYVFCLEVKGRKATSDTINITDEEYEFTAYAMGTLGIRAGVRLTIRVGLLSTELASVGLSADVGGYVQLWGYLYYQYHYSASQGRDSKSMGALYLEVGIYLEIKFRAQALANSFTYSPTLYEAMWPLYTVGTLENVLDFANKDEVEYNLKREMKTIRLSDDFFTMNYLDMKEGLDDGEYFTKVYEDDSDRYFSIGMTNDAFTYDPKTNLITVDPKDAKSVDGEMIITWKSQPGTFNTKPFQRKIKLHWDELKDGYFIAFMSNGGSYVNPICQKYDTVVKTPEKPTRQGYEFAGWYADKDLTQKYNIPGKMPAQDAIVYAKWNPAKVSYFVKTYVESTNGVYELSDGGNVKDKALTGTDVSPVPAAMEGFETPRPKTVTVEADGSSVIEYYYARNKYSATYKSDEEVVSSGAYRYGTMMPVPAVYKMGYEFKGWVKEGTDKVIDVPMLVPAEDVTYFAKWEPLSDIGYTVKYYVQNENGHGYKLDQIQYLTGKTGETVTAREGGYDTAAYHLKDAKLPSGEVTADGSLELAVYYDLNTYAISYNTMAADAVFPEKTTPLTKARPGQKVPLAVPSRGGYQFGGWYLDAEYTEAFDNTMPAHDITLYAKWDKTKVNYTVRHYQANLAILNEDGYPEDPQEETTYSLVSEEVFTAPVGDEVTPDVKTYTGFKSPTQKTEQVTADENGQGNLVINYYYERESYDIVWHIQDDEAVASQVQYGATIVVPDQKEGMKHGYRVTDWYEKDAEAPFQEKTMPAHNLELYPKWEAIDIEYFVTYEFYKPDGQGEYVFDSSYTDTCVGLADSEIDPPEVKTFRGYTFDESSKITGKFKIDPYNPCITYRYNAEKYTLTWKYKTNNGEDTENNANMVYGAEISLPEPTRDGYAFAGWYTDESFQNPYTEQTMPDHDLTLYGKWVDGKQSYQVAHYLTELNGSTKLFQVENLYGEPGEEVTPPSKAPEGFEDVTPITHTLQQGSVKDNLICYVYPRKTYQITYCLNGGSAYWDTVQTLPFGDNLRLYPYRDGYEFVNWYTDVECQNALTEDSVPASDLTLYAKWKTGKSRYVVEHYLQYNYTDDYYLDRREYLEADTDSVVTPQVRQYTGYQSPETQQGTVTGDGALTIQYWYACKEHQLTLHDFCSGGGQTEEKILQAKYGSSIPQQFRAGYTFEGWFKDEQYTIPFSGTMPDEDLILYAKWTPMLQHYTVTYMQQDSSGWFNPVEFVEGEAETDSFVTPVLKTYDGYTAPEVEPVRIEANRYNEIQLKYTINRHTVTFVLDNGEDNVVRSGYYGSKLTAPVPSKEGYTFKGWDAPVADTIPDEDLSYTAQWVVNSYQLSYTVEGEDANQYPEKSYEYNADVEQPVAPVRTGYTFTGWSAAVPTKMPDRDVHLVAQWKPDIYSISYDLDGGRSSSLKETYRYESDEIVLEAPTKAHYIFLGWSGTGIDGIQKNVSIPKHSTGDRSYKANWEAQKYTIEFVPLIGCTVGTMQPLEITYFETKQLPKCAYELEGHTLFGWSAKEQKPSSRPWCNYFDEQLVSNIGSDLKLYPAYQINRYRVDFDFNREKKYLMYSWHDYGSYVKFPNPTPGDDFHRWGYNLVGWEKEENGGYASLVGPKAMSGYTLYDTKNVVWKAWWEPNNTYEYEPSDWCNSYDITDSKKRKISFTFHVDGHQTEEKVTGDYGLGNGAKYVMNMDNMSYDVIHKNYTKMKVTVKYRAKMVQDGYAVMKLSYKTADGKEHSWKKESTDLLDENKNKKFSYELDCGKKVDVKSLKLEFSADGGGADEYILSNLNVIVTFE